MMRLFFGWLRGVETVERPVVKEQLGTIALHCGNDEAGAIGDNCSTLRKQQSRAIGDNCSTLGSTLG